MHGTKSTNAAPRGSRRPLRDPSYPFEDMVREFVGDGTTEMQIPRQLRLRFSSLGPRMARVPWHDLGDM